MVAFRRRLHLETIMLILEQAFTQGGRIVHENKPNFLSNYSRHMIMNTGERVNSRGSTKYATYLTGAPSLVNFCELFLHTNTSPSDEQLFKRFSTICGVFTDFIKEKV